MGPVVPLRFAIASLRRIEKNLSHKIVDVARCPFAQKDIFQLPYSGTYFSLETFTIPLKRAARLRQLFGGCFRIEAVSRAGIGNFSICEKRVH